MRICILLYVYCYMYTVICILLYVYCYMYTVICILLYVYCYMYTVICILLYVYRYRKYWWIVQSRGHWEGRTGSHKLLNLINYIIELDYSLTCEISAGQSGSTSAERRGEPGEGRV